MSGQQWSSVWLVQPDGTRRLAVDRAWPVLAHAAADELNRRAGMGAHALITEHNQKENP